MTLVTCINCGETKHPKHPSAKTFCSRECSYSWFSVVKAVKDRLRATGHYGWAYAPVRTIQCLDCGVPLVSNGNRKRCYRCAAAAKHAYSVKRSSLLYKPSPKKERSCVECSRKFVSGYSRQRYCSRRCGEAEGNRQDQYRRRRLLKSKWVAGVTLRYVIKRDGGRCQRCGVKCIKRGKRYDPRRPTLDHIVPLSRGGGHTPENVQLACWRCNSIKASNVGGDQLLLVG